MINLFKNTKPKATPNPENFHSEASLHQINSYVPPDTLLSEIWLCLAKKWRHYCFWRLNSLEFSHKNFSNTDYQRFLEDFLHLCKSYKVEQLKKFEFHFEEHDFHRLSINSNILGKLFKEAFPHLQTLCLSFVNFKSQIQKKDIIPLMMVIGRQLCNLTKLSLSFERSAMDDECLSKIFESKNMGLSLKLTSLELNLMNCSRISNKGFMILFNDLTRSFNMLKSLNLNLSKTCINDMSIEKLMTLINQRLAHLEVLKIDFTDCKNIRGTSLSPFGNKGNNSGPQLRIISLIFDGCTDLWDEGLCAVGSLVQKHQKTLKAFHLSVNRCKKITDKGFKTFISEYLNSLENLKEIELDFGMCSKMTDEVLEVLAIGLGRLERIEKLGLSLFACNGITDKGVQVLGYEIHGRLMNLKDLKLDFLYANYISKQMLNTFVEAFGTLSKVSINFI